MINIFNDGVEASTRKSQARFQIIRVSSSAKPRLKLEKSENLHEIPLSLPQPHHKFYQSRNSIQLFHTFLCNSQNYHPRGAVDDPMHCCPRPKAEGNSASGHPQHRGGDSFDCCTERYEIAVLLPNSEDTCYWKYFLKFE